MVTELKALHSGKWTISWLTEDNEADRMVFDPDVYPGAVFNTAANLVAFGDLTGVRMIRVRHNGRSYKYAGWMPGMLIEFEALGSGHVVWSERYPHWDH